ncbi:MAG: flagellar biosynthesis protein FlhF [Burkholderiaceae bacterium]|jgi:flagellar biosynthesis protein FlhF|nr:flagellar biosynthesis protein FlhF [Burkholderiaceae bacterium]
MNVKKFTAKSTREAMRLVRETLGPDAVILSNRETDGIVEILGVAPEDMSSLTAPVFDPETTPPMQPKRMQTPPPQRVASPHGTATMAGDVDKRLKNMASELRVMRNMFETQLTEITWGNKQNRDPARAQIMREMLTAGFSAGMARYLIENLPEREKEDDGGWRWIRRALTQNLKTIANEDHLLAQGGIYALVGPTGVGKTTTTAKLAARYVMRHGTSNLALITTDGYRIGGFEQLRIYGKIMGVIVHSVKDLADLRVALDELRSKHTILIDTVGMSQRDRMVTDQVAMLSNTGREIRRLLCLSATSTAETLNEVVQAYSGNGLAGCIMTKRDEAVTIGNLLDIIIRRKLILYYVANGQRVPEDMELARSADLVASAFNTKKDAQAFSFEDDELPIVVAHALSVMKKERLRSAGRE